MWVILILSIVTVHNRIHYTFLALNDRPIPSGPNALTAAFSRAFFWRDERGTFPYDLWVVAILALRVADAARLAARPDGCPASASGAGSSSDAMAASDHVLDTAYALEALRAFGPVLSIKRYRLTLDPAPAVPTLPCLDHEAMLHEGIPPHAAAYVQDASSGDLHELVLIPAKRRIDIDTVSTWGEYSEESLARLKAHVAQRFPQHTVRVTGPSWWRGERRVAAACRAQVSLRDVLLAPDIPRVKASAWTGCRSSAR